MAWVLAVGGIALGLALAAPQILMTLDYIAATPRAFLDYEAFVAYSLPWSQLPTLLFPFLFGGMGAPLGTPYFGADNFAELCLYLPFLSIALALAGATYGPRSVARFWALVAVVAFLLALGGSLPALAHVVYRLPGFDLFRVPARHVLDQVNRRHAAVPERLEHPVAVLDPIAGGEWHTSNCTTDRTTGRLGTVWNTYKYTQAAEMIRESGSALALH